jgi:hypothetical protein
MNLFSDLSGRPWFYRLWTLQESVLAQEALVICGKWSISWKVLILAMGRLRPLENANGRFDFISAFDYVLRGRQAVVDALLSPNVSHPVSTVFTRGLLLQAREPRDHVFGLYALFQKLGVQLSKPDYTKPVDQVFAEAARLAVKRDNKLHILTFVNGLEQRQNWPSWVPTWPDKLVPSALDEQYFMAAEGSLPLYKFSEEGRCLTVQAKKVDIVSLKAELSPHLGDPLPPNDRASIVESSLNAVKAYQEWMIVMHTWRILARMVPSRYGDADQQFKAFIRVLLQDLPCPTRCP